MAGKIDPCAGGLSAACFAAQPVWAKTAFAYRLFCALAPPNVSRRLQKYLLKGIFAPGVDVPSGFVPDTGTTFPPGFVFPPGWSPGDPLPEGFVFPPGAPIPPGETGPAAPLFLSPFEPGPVKTGGGAPPAPEPITVKLFGSLSNGRVISRANNWPDARNGNDYLNAVSDEYSAGDAISAYFEGALYYINRTFLYFDLSGIESLSKVTSAILGVVGAENAESSVRVYKGTQEDPLEDADFDAFEGYPLALADWQYYIAPDFNTNLMELSASGKTHVEDSWPGTVKFCLREDTKDRANVAPDALEPLNGVNFAKWTIEDYKPSLTLVYV